MTLSISKLRSVNRLLMEEELVPVQGSRFQPTGFPNLGAATFTRPDGTEMLLVESAQSMANRLELVAWDEERQGCVKELEGLPYVRAVDAGGNVLTNSLLEAHRINSPYFLESADKTFFQKLAEDTNIGKEGAVSIPEVARIVFRYDPNSVIHGVFLAKGELGGGQLRLKRLLSSFVEAEEVRPAESGGVKMDRINPKGDTNKGFGHVPFHRTEFTAGSIRIFFNIDLSALRSYHLPEEAQQLLLDLSLWKIRRLLAGGLRFRTACDLEPGNALAVKPDGLALPDQESLDAAVREGIRSCAALFAEPRITEVTWVPPRGGKKEQEDD